MANQEGALFSRQNIVAIGWGLAVLYGGGLLLYILFSRAYVWAEDPDIISNLVSTVFLAIMYALSGFVVVKKVQIKAWSLAIIPTLLLLLYVSLLGDALTFPPHTVLDWLGLPFIVGMTFVHPLADSLQDIYVVGALILFALVGGIAAKHIRLRW